MTHPNPIIAFGLTEPDWQTVHQTIDEIFDELEARIRRGRPDVTSRGERVQAARFQFNYRAFDPPAGSAGREALVVGILFEPRGDRIHITGDICTEESGRVLYDEPCERLAVRPASELAAAAGDIARRLAAQWELILDNLGPTCS